jgi:hypothetical protein
MTSLSVADAPVRAREAVARKRPNDPGKKQLK